MIRRRALLGTLALAACARGVPERPRVELSLIAGPGLTRATAVRIYQLVATDHFLAAPPSALLGHEQATLGTDDLGMEEILLRPGETRHVGRTWREQAKYIGVAVLFDGSGSVLWRDVAALAHDGTSDGPSRVRLDVEPGRARLRGLRQGEKSV